MADLSKIFLFRMTHIVNIPHILLHGITHINSPSTNQNYQAIGDSTLINTRSEFVMPNGRRLGEYIPFYFGPRTPMLYVVQKGLNGVKLTSAQDIVYCVTSIDKILQLNLNFVFTNGHAVDALSDFFDIKNINDVDTIIKKNDVYAKYWKDDVDTDLKRRREAEFLVETDISSAAILGYIVYNQVAKNTMLAYGIQDNNIHLRTNFYF